MIFVGDGTQSRRYVHSTAKNRDAARDVKFDVRGGITDPYGSPESAWGFARDALPLAIDPNEEKSCARSTHPPTTFLAAAVELNRVAGNFAAPQPPTCNKVGPCNTLAHDHLDSPPPITAPSIARMDL